jgi:hypothetical protein
MSHPGFLAGGVGLFLVPHQSPFRIKTLGPAPQREGLLAPGSMSPRKPSVPCRVQMVDNALPCSWQGIGRHRSCGSQALPGPTPCGFTAEAIPSQLPLSQRPSTGWDHGQSDSVVVRQPQCQAHGPSPTPVSLTRQRLGVHRRAPDHGGKIGVRLALRKQGTAVV